MTDQPRNRAKPPDNTTPESGSRRTDNSWGRYADDPPRPLVAWVLVSAKADLLKDGAINAREIVRVVGVDAFPAIANLTLIYEIPFDVAPQGALLTFQVERPTGEDARDFLPENSVAHVDPHARVARRVTQLGRVRFNEPGWHTIRIHSGDRVLAETSVLARVVDVQKRQRP